jgi:competence protein CoiA
MLTALRHSDQLKVLARHSEKTDAPYICPACKREVVLHKGNFRTHHFKHKPPVTCFRGQGETEEHLKAKLGIYDALAREFNVVDLELEKDFGISVADVYVKISGKPIAIEIQRSKVTIDDICARTVNYYKLGVAVLWVGLHSSELSGGKYSPRVWERWCHAAYFGRVYYWESGQVLRPVHFGPYLTYVEPTSWYESGGIERSEGGYERTAKRYKKPHAGDMVVITRSFRSTHKDAWSCGKISVPECLLYVDNQKKWW